MTAEPTGRAGLLRGGTRPLVRLGLVWEYITDIATWGQPGRGEGWTGWGQMVSKSQLPVIVSWDDGIGACATTFSTTLNVLVSKPGKSLSLR